MIILSYNIYAIGRLHLPMRAKHEIKTFADKFARRIMTSTYKRPKSAQQLSDELRIPLPTCHRKLREMEKYELVKFREVDSTKKGHLVKLYSCEWENSSLVFEDGEFKFQCQRKENDAEGENGKWIVLTSTDSNSKKTKTE